MSWSISTTVTDKDIVAEDQEKITEEGLKISEEAREQLVIALLSLPSIIETGVVGDPSGSFGVTLSGHANPEHKPAAGWANDCLTISIYQK